MAVDSPSKLKILGNYEVLNLIAEGGMGAVYRARSLATDKIVAIKIIPAETAKNPLLLRRFEQEFRVASMIDHCNVVKALDYCGTGSTPYLVMEFVDGESLGQRIERAGPIPESEAVRLMEQVCSGLHRAHKQGLIHRDVKPDNILLTFDGNIAKLTDLGLVKDIEGELNLTRTGKGLGTPHYMAPEQFRNAKMADVRCDVYSLAATLYSLVTGVTPFAKTTPLDCWIKKTKNDFIIPKKLVPSLSERVSWAITRAMDAEPSNRPASCREFMEDLAGKSWHGNETPKAASTDDLWYMVYRDDNDEVKTVKGATESIRRNLIAGALGRLDLIQVSRTKTGQFISLRSTPEFRDLILTNTPAPVTVTRSTPMPNRSKTIEPDAKPNDPTRSPNQRQPISSPADDITAFEGVASLSNASHSSASRSRASRQITPPVAQPKLSFDWGALLLIVVAIIATSVGLLLFMK